MREEKMENCVKSDSVMQDVFNTFESIKEQVMEIEKVALGKEDKYFGALPSDQEVGVGSDSLYGKIEGMVFDIGNSLKNISRFTHRM